MTSIDYYLSLPYTMENTMEIVRDTEGGGYVAWIKELDGCITQSETWEELIVMIDDAKRLWLEVALEHHDPIPEPEPIALNK